MRTSQPHHEVILPGPQAFQTMLESTMVEIEEQKFTVDHDNRKLKDFNGGVKDEFDGGDDEAKLKIIQRRLKRAEEAVKALIQFHNEITKYWSQESSRVIGHVAFSSSVTVSNSAERYSEDWALIELDRDKIDWDSFPGNLVDLGTF